MSSLERKSWSVEVISKQEDDKLKQLVHELGLKRWSTIAEILSTFSFETRSGKQCRERWLNHLDPSIRNQEFSLEEQDKVFELNEKLGNQWSKIAKLLPGRTENSIKNYFYSTVRKNIRRVNKLLVLPQKILGSVKDLRKNQDLKQLLFCNPKRCLQLARKLKRTQKMKEETGKNRPDDERAEMQEVLNDDTWRSCQETYANHSMNLESYGFLLSNIPVPSFGEYLAWYSFYLANILK